MTLPANNVAWPPAQLTGITEKYREWGAWYSGDVAELGTVYAKPERRGIVGAIRRWFVGEKPSDANRISERIHVNLAQEIPRTSANLLFSEPVKVTGEDAKAEDRLELICGPEFDAAMVGAAEAAAALGGVFLRASWDRKVANHVFISKVDADLALPVFAWGKLRSVQFWRVLSSENNTVWRHVEEHDVDAFGIGVIYHGLYEGTSDKLGHAVPLVEHPATVGLAADVDENSAISTLTPGLSAVYVPNITPSALWRKHSIGAYLGRSDLEGIEQQLDALDELHSAWLRDIRLGKGRLIVSEKMLKDFGVGQGEGFDLDETIFTPVKGTPGATVDQKLGIEQVQFKIRTEDFKVAIEFFKRSILGAAGYSPQTFGLVEGGPAVTAKEITARERTSYLTRARKVRAFKPPLEAITSKALAVDAAVFGTGVTDFSVTVDFADAVSDDPESIARQNQLDAGSNSASIRTRVRRIHPDWTGEQVDVEVAAIRLEAGLAPAEKEVEEETNPSTDKEAEAPVAAA